ncbi:hypothetical protein QK289_08935 [Exiguobacterium antarcticum]|uniref:WGR domain-containing protein n=1 Tax=Exiguobacterium antarcticum TaxID=132920 RepID=A0ABT6R2V6_9BACL|nr:hypothetical protein [Exiguobacterium antarcticum]MDI3235128.1 hypothetical protein [Exiguobacterium antarcticum]
MKDKQAPLIQLKREISQTVDYWVCYRVGRTLYQVSVQEQANGQTNQGEITTERFPFYFGMKQRMRQLAEEKAALGFRPLTEAEQAAHVIEAPEESSLNPAFFDPAIRLAWLLLGLGVLLFVLPYERLNNFAFGLGLYVWYETFRQAGLPKFFRRYFHGMFGALMILQVLSAFELEREIQPYYATLSVLSAVMLVLLVVQYHWKETDQIAQDESVRIRKIKEYTDFEE